eukprot:3425415-Prymnesium_polylepis.1
MAGITVEGHQGIVFQTDTGGKPIGYVFSSQEVSQGSSYKDTYFYDCCPNSPWPIAKYHVHVKRASAFYKDAIIVPGVLLTTASFGVFFMSFQVGERLSYGVTLIVAVQVAQQTVATFTPIAGELLWVELFNMTNMFFCYGAMYETIVVLFLGFFTGSHILPTFLRAHLPATRRMEKFFSKCFGPIEITQLHDELQEEKMVLEKESMASVLFRRYQRAATSKDGRGYTKDRWCSSA